MRRALPGPRGGGEGAGEPPRRRGGGRPWGGGRPGGGGGRASRRGGGGSGNCGPWRRSGRAGPGGSLCLLALEDGLQRVAGLGDVREVECRLVVGGRAGGAGGTCAAGEIGAHLFGLILLDGA